MNEEIKKRIEQIKRGELPEGYKTTKSGIVPNDWIQTTVGKCMKEYKVLSNDITNIPVYSSSRNGLIPQAEYYDQKKSTETNLGYKVVPQGYVTYRHMSDDDVFHFNINATGTQVLVSAEYPVFTASTNAVLDFLIPALNETARFRNFCRAQKLGGTRTRLYLKNLSQYLLCAPDTKEQQKISEILTTCDKLISLKKELIAEKEKLKKSCLSKLFPKQGSSVPEIRFPGFTDAWELRKLSEIADFGKGQGYTKSDLKEAGTPIILYGRLYTKYQTIIREVDTFADVISGAVLSNGGEVILPSSGETAEDIAIAASVDKSGILLGGGLNVILPHEEIESSFLAAEISFATPHTDLAKLAQGKSIVHLYNEDLKKVVISYPSIEEQAKISTMLDSIDHLITLHRRELVEMEKYKKALMQMLLTGIVRVS